MFRNSVFLGSVMDSDRVWHAVICSPHEDTVHKYCELIAGDKVADDDDIDRSAFWSSKYTVDLVPILVPEDDYPEEEDWDTWDTDNIEDMVFNEQ